MQFRVIIVLLFIFITIGATKVKGISTLSSFSNIGNDHKALQTINNVNNDNFDDSWEDDSSLSDSLSNEETENSDSSDVDFIRNQRMSLVKKDSVADLEFQKLWKNAVFTDRICFNSYMTIAVPFAILGVKREENTNPFLFLQICYGDLAVKTNLTHLIFNFSYDSFSKSKTISPEKESGLRHKCGVSRKLISENATAFVFELPASSFPTVMVPENSTFVGYCHFEKLETMKEPLVDGSIRFYPSSYERVPYSTTMMYLRSGDTVVFEIASDNGLLDVQNLPVNCWLSPHATLIDSIREMFGNLFMRNGCPAKEGVALLYTPRPRIVFVMEMKEELQKRKFLYVHCQYVKCTNSTVAMDQVILYPKCPWHQACIQDGLTTLYNDTRLSFATSDTVLVAIYEPPHEVHVPSAGHAEYDSSVSARSIVNSGKFNSGDSQDSGIAIWMIMVLCFVSFLVGFTLAASICWFDRKRVSKELHNRKMHLETINSQSLLPKGALSLQAQPDVLLQTPSAVKRSMIPRQRHFSGHDGNAPPEPAPSFHPTLSMVVGGSTIIANDEMWLANEIDHGDPEKE